VIPEADLPFEDRRRDACAGARRQPPPADGRAAGRPPVDVLENILYGRTEKDDPESSHHGEHEISDGVDRD